ncbi:MAG: hypothetical protein PVJ67_02215 [Candidatus Pacearchaeota archaeon]|jgi:membrane protein YqaA with SNARE-associated domain
MINFESVLEQIGIYRFVLIPILSVFGCNMLTSSFLYPVLFFMHQNGMNLFLLSGLTTIGATTGDLLFLFFGKKINENSGRTNHRVTKFFRRNRDSRYIKFFIFFYAAFFPTSNEFMTLGFGYIDYPFRKTFLPLLLGNIFYFTIMIWLGGIFLGKIF